MITLRFNCTAKLGLHTLHDVASIVCQALQACGGGGSGGGAGGGDGVPRKAGEFKRPEMTGVVRPAMTGMVRPSAAELKPELSDEERFLAGGLLRTSTGPTLNLPLRLLLQDVYELSP